MLEPLRWLRRDVPIGDPTFKPEREASAAVPVIRPAPILLYSTNTWLAFIVAETYYNGVHYVWCTPRFGDRSVPNDIVLPPSSRPYEIYRRLHEEVHSGDRHSPKVRENKAGILRGAASKRAAGVINEQQESDIASIVERAELADFRPLLYQIPYGPVSALLREVPISKKAHPLSKEYKIEELPRKYFEPIEFPRMGG